jgi:hypothetical protein
MKFSNKSRFYIELVLSPLLRDKVFGCSTMLQIGRSVFRTPTMLLEFFNLPNNSIGTMDQYLTQPVTT